MHTHMSSFYKNCLRFRFLKCFCAFTRAVYLSCGHLFCALCISCFLSFDCQYQCNWLSGRIVSKMTHYVSSGTLNPTNSLHNFTTLPSIPLCCDILVFTLHPHITLRYLLTSLFLGVIYTFSYLLSYTTMAFHHAFQRISQTSFEDETYSDCWSGISQAWCTEVWLIHQCHPNK